MLHLHENGRTSCNILEYRLDYCHCVIKFRRGIVSQFGNFKIYIYEAPHNIQVQTELNTNINKINILLFNRIYVQLWYICELQFMVMNLDLQKKCSSLLLETIKKNSGLNYRYSFEYKWQLPSYILWNTLLLFWNIRNIWVRVRKLDRRQGLSSIKQKPKYHLYSKTVTM